MQQAKHIGKVIISHRAAVGTEFRPDASYIITGGFGGLGMLVANWMADRGARHLTLLGRRGKPPSAATAVAELEKKGVTVTCLACDTGVDADVKRVVDATNTASTPLRGIMHAAGFLRDALDTSDTRHFVSKSQDIYLC